MAGEFAVAPPGLRSVSGDLHDVSYQVSGLKSALRAQIGGAGGDAIAAGDAESFWSQLDWVDGSLEAKADLLDYYANQLRQAANTFKLSDEGELSDKGYPTRTNTPGA
jgi:uncharacterized protein YukE